MIIKLAAGIVALGMAGSAQAQEGAPFRVMVALPATACFANTHADERLLHRSIEGLKNTSTTRAVWVTCSMPAINAPVPPTDDIRVTSIAMWATTDLARVTVPCKAGVNIGSPTGDFVYFWNQATTNVDKRALVHIEPDTGRFVHSSFGITCKIPQASALTQFQVVIAQTDFVPME